MSLELEASKRLGALDLEVELRVEDGETLALAGPSGAGKSSVLRAVAGLLRPARGRVKCGGETWFDSASGRSLPPERRRCGYLFQEYALFPHLSALGNVAYGAPGRRGRERRATARALLERLGVAHLSQARPRTLSGGERQRVALARALAPRPRALLLDEPLSALDARTRAVAGRVVGEVLRDADVPAVLVTHDFAEASLLGDRVAVMDQGRVIQSGTAAELAAAPVSAFVADFTGAVVLPGTARRGHEGLTLVELDGGGTIASLDDIEGPAAASVYPWEIAVEPLGQPRHGSAQNRVPVEVTSVTEVGSRVRLGLSAPQPLAAEVSAASVRELGLRPGSRVTASWKAAATRLVPL